MQYFQALQRKDGKWDYTVTWDKRTMPTGYCRTKCSGHTTKEEAEECFRIYQIDNTHFWEVPFDDDKRDQHEKCSVCGVWTMSHAQIGSMDIYPLCPTHLNRESLLKIVPAPGYVMSSCGIA
jgi:hypothetical protein